MQRNYFSGIIGGILGGLVCSIPWVLVYVFGNMLLSALTILIGIGVLKGYQLFKGKVSKGLPWIVMIISLLIVAIEVLCIIPLISLAKAGYPANFTILSLLYSDSDYLASVLGDVAMSLLFTVLGVSGVFASIKKQLNGDPAQKINYGANTQKSSNIAAIRDYFLANQATIPENAISVDYSSGLNQEEFFNLKDSGIIVEEAGKYYYSLESEKTYDEYAQEQRAASRARTKKALIITAVIMAVIMVLVVGILIISDDDMTKIEMGTQAQFSIPKNQFTYEEDSQYADCWYVYYADDENLLKGYLYIDYYEDDYAYDDDVYASFKENFSTYEDVVLLSYENIKTSNGYDCIVAVLYFEETDEYYPYYDICNIVFVDDDVVYVEAIADSEAYCHDLINDSKILDYIKAR